MRSIWKSVGCSSVVVLFVFLLCFFVLLGVSVATPGTTGGEEGEGGTAGLRRDATVHVVMGSVPRNSGEYLYIRNTIHGWCSALAEFPESRKIDWDYWVFNFSPTHQDTLIGLLAEFHPVSVQSSDMFTFDFGARIGKVRVDGYDGCRVHVVSGDRKEPLAPHVMSDKRMKHSFDVSFMMQHVHGLFGKRSVATGSTGKFQDDLMMLMDDDFEPCPWALDRLEHAILRHLDADFSAGMFSFGTSGLLFHVNDLPALVEYIAKGQERPANVRRPIDHLLDEWMLKETDLAKNYLKKRRNFTVRYHPFAHKGIVSTQDHSHFDGQYGCWDQMTWPTLFVGIAYDTEKCGVEHDVWPCWPRED
eukprot:ANDGO_02386.mRNA.1 hypothetical protein GUITHDRAFT_109638